MCDDPDQEDSLGQQQDGARDELGQEVGVNVVVVDHLPGNDHHVGGVRVRGLPDDDLAAALARRHRLPHDVHVVATHQLQRLQSLPVPLRKAQSEET